MKVEDIHQVSMIGAGTMGAGMSLCFSQAGYKVNLFDIKPEQLEFAEQRIRNSQKVFIDEGLLSSDDAELARRRITLCTSLEESLDGAQYLVEAISERLTLKQALFRQIEQRISETAILTSNTSGLSITEIASVCQRPDRIAGMHWVNPPEYVPLVEVVRGEKTSQETIDTVKMVAEKLGKVAVVVNKDIPGFASNRLQYALLREALYLVESGVVSAEDVDRTLKCGVGFRYPWLGPLETVDLGGLDIFHGVAQYLFPQLSTMQNTPEFFNALVEEGRLGIKTGQGFYDYKDCSREEILRLRDLFFIRQWQQIQKLTTGEQDK